ncbi:hypothetical protein PU13_02810 [Escherichia coli]|uniref:hypothetical protein n=1 Tax=Escherichia coli TaxID=562 RepID=UPI000589BD68|nr:hypothetical protein [Escherichia coli]KIH32541.1 hypothetical protein PU13_02810 [Escherichia coli]
MLKGCQSEACCNRGCIHLVVMTTICGNVTTSDMSACWANYKNSGDVNNVNRDMRNLWLKIKDWFTGQNSNDIIRAFIANRQNALECLCNSDELSAFQSSFTDLYKAVSQNLRSGVQCSLSKVDMTDSKYNEIQRQYPGKAPCVLKLPDGTALGYTLLPNEQAEILCSIDEQISSGSIDAKMQYTVFCSVADLLTQAETLQSTNSETCTTECISSFQLACVRFFQSLSAANIYVGSSCVYNATECHNGRFGRVTMKFNDTTIVDIGLRCADNDPEFVLSNTVTDDTSQIFKIIRNDVQDVPENLSSYFRIQRLPNGQLGLPAAQRNRGRVVLDQYQQKLEYDLLDDNINNTAFVLAHLTLIDRFFPNPDPDPDLTPNINKYSYDFQTQGQIMGIISEIERDDVDAAEYMAENWVSFTPYGNNSNACVRMGDNGALPTMDNLSPLVQRAVENTRTELANGDIQTEKQRHEDKLRNVALQRLGELDSTGGLTTKYGHYPIEGVLLEDENPWVLFDKTGFSELKYISLCLLASSSGELTNPGSLAAAN